MKNLAVDLGNFNIKTSEDVCFVSTYTSEKQINPSMEQMIGFNGIEYCMEKGTFDKEYNKAAKDYLPNLLYAIVRSTDEEEINLVLGLPITQLAKSEELKKDLEGKTFEFEYNEDPKKVTINKLAIVAEGLSSFYALSERERAQDLTIIDIGGKTTNIVTMVDKKVHDKDTLTYGILSLYKDICDVVNNDGGRLEEEKVNIKLKWKELDKYEEQINYLKVKFIDRIKNDLKDIEVAPKIIFAGGGSDFIGELLTEHFSNSKLIEDPVFSNVKGNLNLANKQWR